MDHTKMTESDAPAVTASPTPTATMLTGLDQELALLTAGTVVGELTDGRIELDDGTIDVIVTSDGSGKIEYGVVISGTAASSIDDGELVLRTASGLVFTPAELNRDGDTLSTTINAYHGDEDYITLSWEDRGETRFLLFTGTAGTEGHDTLTHLQHRALQRAE
jgi:hypothetical protein